MPADGSSFDVEYPVNYNDDVLNEQTYVENGIAKGLMKMSTSSPGTIDEGFALEAKHAVLDLQLTGNSEIGKQPSSNRSLRRIVLPSNPPAPL